MLSAGKFAGFSKNLIVSGRELRQVVLWSRYVIYTEQDTCQYTSGVNNNNDFICVEYFPFVYLYSDANVTSLLTVSFPLVFGKF